MIDALIAYYDDLRREGYNLTGLQKLVTPVLGRTSMSKLRSGARPLVIERIKKKIGVSLTPQMEETIAAGAEMGEGRKSGQYSGKVTNKQFDKFFKDVKEFLDRVNEERQGKRAAPATEKAKEAVKVSKERAAKKAAAKEAPTREGKKAEAEPTPAKPAAKQRLSKTEWYKQQMEGMTREEKVKYLSGKQSEEAKALLKEMVAEKAVELPKKKEAEPAAKPAEARKLRSITVRVPAQVAETGEMTMINERADAALEYEMKRIEQLKQIVRCLVS